MKAIGTLCLLVLLLASASAEAEAGKLKGYMFGDYYYVAAADDGEAKYPEKQNAFQFRRLYLTYNRNLSDDFSVRYRLEAKDAGFGAGAKMEPFVKHAYLRWRGAVAGSDLCMGLAGTPSWAISESVWGYRSIEKTVLDLNKIGSSADLGVALIAEAEDCESGGVARFLPSLGAQDVPEGKAYLRFFPGRGERIPEPEALGRKQVLFVASLENEPDVADLAALISKLGWDRLHLDLVPWRCRGAPEDIWRFLEDLQAAGAFEHSRMAALLGGNLEGF